MAWTTTRLLEHVRRVASLPTASSVAGYADADLLAHADAALQGRLLPFVTRHRDEHGIHQLDVTATSEFVRLPPRVAAGHLRDVTAPNPAGAPGYVSVPRLEPEDLSDWYIGAPVSQQQMAFVVQAGFLRLVPAPPTGGATLRLTYVRTASTLALVSSCVPVTTISSGTTVAMGHAAISGALTAAQDVILVSNGDSLGDSMAVGGGGSTTVTNFASTSFNATFGNTATEVARYLAEGLYICPAGTTCIIPLPDLVSPLLAQRTAVAVMDAIGDREASQRMADIADNMEAELSTTIGERVEGEPQKVRPKFNRRARGFWRGW